MASQRTINKSCRREDLMSVVKNRDVDQLIALTKSASGSELSDAIAELSKANLEQLWENIYGLCTSSLMSDGDIEDAEFAAKMNRILKSTTDLAQATVTALLAQRPNNDDDEKTAMKVTHSLQESVILLHGLLPNIEASQTPLKNQMSRLFEDWWSHNLEGRLDVATNTILYLLTRSTQPKAPQADVSRVWAMRGVLENVSLADHDGGTLVSLLQQCTHHPQFISTNHGVRFLSFIMALNPDLTDKLHQCIKNVIFTTPRSWHSKFGEIYFRSWQGASETMRKKIEESCIQDLMFRAIHASRQGSHCPSASLYRVMSYFHKQKTQRGVEAMLVRLYGPILWRSLKVPNSDVRLNAASLVFSVFPLQDPNHLREEADAALQRQFDVMHSLLSDPVVEIRAAAILGIGRVLGMYWELIPVQVIQSLMATLVQDMINDAASPNVREAVLKVMFQLCDNHLCIPVLKKVLPELGNFVHDTSEKVRVAMLDLLLKVKGLRAIKYWNIVPIEHILARLEIDSHLVVRRIMSLIYASFVPLNHPPSQQVERCLTLISSNRGAARQFFLNLPKHLGVVDTSKYILVLCRYALEGTRLWSKSSVSIHLQSEDRNEDSQEESDSGRSRKKPKANTGKKRRSTRSIGRSGNDGEGDDDESSAETSQGGSGGGGGGEEVFDMESLSGLMEAVYLMFTSIVSQLSSSEHAGLKDGLMKKLSVTVRELIKISQDPLLEDALVGLAGHLPSRTMPLVSQNLFNKLKERSSNKDVVVVGCSGSSSDLTTTIKALVQWGRADDLLELVEDSVLAFLKKENGNPSKGAKQSPKGRKKVVAFNTEESTIDVEKALQILNNMMSHAECRPILMNKHKKRSASFIESLEKEIYVKFQEHLKHFSGESGDDNGNVRGDKRKGSPSTLEADMALSLSIFNSCMRLAVFLCLKPDDGNKENVDGGDKNKGGDGDDEMQVGYSYLRNCLTWILQTILPQLQSVPAKLTTQLQRSHRLALQLVVMAMKACSGLVMVGTKDTMILDLAGEICLVVLKLPLSSVTNCLVQSVLVLTYQLTQLREVVDVSEEAERMEGEEEQCRTNSDEDNGSIKANAPSKHPLQFALLVLESAFKMLTAMSEESSSDSSSSKSNGTKLRNKNTDASSFSESESVSTLHSSTTTILLALVKRGVSQDMFEKTMRVVADLVIGDVERLSRLELIGGPAAATTTAEDTDCREDAGGLTGLNAAILTCLKKYPKTQCAFTEEVIQHVESAQVNIHSLHGVLFLADALKLKTSKSIDPDLKEAINKILKTISANGMDEDVFRDVKSQVEQKMKA